MNICSCTYIYTRIFSKIFYSVLLGEPLRSCPSDAILGVLLNYSRKSLFGFGQLKETFVSDKNIEMNFCPRLCREIALNM